VHNVFDGVLRIFDSHLLIYVVLGLIPNLFLILWAMARLSHRVHVLNDRVSTLERELAMAEQTMTDMLTDRPAGTELAMGDPVRSSKPQA
jgi:hypothetical protein